MSRAQDRSTFTADVRIRLLETDADGFEVLLKELREGQAKMVSSSNKVLISMSASAVMLAIDVLTRVVLR